MTYVGTGNDFLVHPTATGTQVISAMFALPGGKFAIEYRDETSPAAPRALVRIFDGTTGGKEITLDQAGGKALLSDGRFVQIEAAYPYSVINAQFLDAKFAPLGSPKVLVTDPYPSFETLLPQGALGLPDGGFLIGFSTRLNGGFETALYLQRLMPPARRLAMWPISALATSTARSILPRSATGASQR